VTTAAKVLIVVFITLSPLVSISQLIELIKIRFEAVALRLHALFEPVSIMWLDHSYGCSPFADVRWLNLGLGLAKWVTRRFVWTTAEGHCNGLGWSCSLCASKLEI